MKIAKIAKDADRDYWMSAVEAKNYGLIDSVLERRKINKKEDGAEI